MSEWDGTCGTCGWRALGNDCHLGCVHLGCAFLDVQCGNIERRTLRIRELVTSPEFVPEDVQLALVTQVICGLGWADKEEGSDDAV